MEKRGVNIEHTAHERVALVGMQFYRNRGGRYALEDYLDELSMLAQTAGGEEVVRFTQNAQAPDPRTYVGRGKAEEIAGVVKEQEIDTVVFDDELSPSQQRNLEEAL